MEELVIKLLTDAVLSGVLLFLYLRQETRLSKLEDKVMGVLDLLLDDTLNDRSAAPLK